MKTGIKILLDNDKEEAKELLRVLSSEKIPFNDPKRHAEMLGCKYDKDFEKDPKGAIQRLMVELKILSVFGKHCCPPALLLEKQLS